MGDNLFSIHQDLAYCWGKAELTQYRQMGFYLVRDDSLIACLQLIDNPFYYRAFPVMPEYLVWMKGSDGYTFFKVCYVGNFVYNFDVCKLAFSSVADGQYHF